MNPVTAAGGVHFDMTINLTLVVGVIVWVITLAIAWTKFGSRLDMVDMQIESMEKVLDRVSLTLERFSENTGDIKLLKAEFTALQTSHAALHRTVEQLRVGEGYITGPRRANLVGEYPASKVGG